MMLLLAVCTFTTAWAQNYITGIYTNYSSGQTVTSGTLANLFDNNTNTKLSMEFSSDNVPSVIIEFKTSEPIYPTAYEIASWTDDAGYPPIPSQWMIYARKSPSDSWSYIDSRTTDALTSDYTHKSEFEVTYSKDYYQYFKITFLKNSTVNYLNLSDFKFRGYKVLNLNQGTLSGVKARYVGGTNINVNPIVTCPDGSNPAVTLVEGLHYTKTITNSNNETVSTVTADGDYTVTVTGISPCTGSLSAGFSVVSWPGQGTESNPYKLFNTDHLAMMADVVNSGDDDFSGKYFQLFANIYFDTEGLAEGESNFTPIGYYNPNILYGRYFAGNFDGNGKVISGIRVYGSTNDAGIFGYSSGTVKNLTLTDAVITSSTDYTCIGGIVGRNNLYGTVQNCHVTNTVTLNGTENVGGIVGYNYVGKVISSTSAANVSGDEYVGGIVGYNYKSDLYDNLAVGATVAAGGAIVGVTEDTGNAGPPHRNYYFNCTVDGVANATNVGAASGDVDGARFPLPVNLPATLTWVSDPYGNGIVYNNQLYAGATETLTLNAEETLGYLYQYTATNAIITTTINPSGNTYSLTIASDATSAVTVGFSEADVWGIADGADGSEEHPYIITTTEGLDLLATLVNSGYSVYEFYNKYFKLGDNIIYDSNDLTIDNDGNGEGDSNYMPIGGGSSTTQFHGTFDGDGHTISGIRIYNPTQNNQGVFGALGSNKSYCPVVKNLTLSNVFITGLQYVGGIAGNMSYSLITNCHVTNTVSIQTMQNYGGGIVSRCTKGSTVSYCTSAATVTPPNDGRTHRAIGGIVGSNYGILSHNLAVGAIVSGERIGAIAGFNGDYDDQGTLDHNYYANCNIGGVVNTPGVGRTICVYDDTSEDYLIGDEPENDGAVPGFVLYDSGTDNATIISENNGQTKNVILFGRTLRKDGTWNTLCLPFDVVVGSGQLEDATAMTFKASTSGFDSTKGELSLYFDEVTEGNTIAAGTPFIVKWESDTEGTKGTADTELRNPVFSGVTINDVNADDVTSTDGKVSFLGNFSPVALTGGDRSNLCLGTENQLYWPSADGTLNAFRAYLHVDGMVQVIQGEPALALLGDVNTNGGIDIGDAVCIVNYLVNKLNTSFNPAVADLNGNGQIDIGDAVMIVNILVGKTNTPSAAPLMTTEEGLQTTDNNEPQ